LRPGIAHPNPNDHAVVVLVTRIGPALGSLLDQQHDVVSRGQLLTAGVDDMTMYRRVRAGAWQRLLPGIYLTGPMSAGSEQRRIAAALYAGPQAQLTGISVLHWYGFRHAPSTDKVHVLVPHAMRCRSSGFVIVQRTLTMDQAERHAALYRVTSPARAVVDACRALTELRHVRAVVAEAVHNGHASPNALDEEIRRAARSRTALVRRALTEIFDGVRSAPEAELRDLTGRSKVLPRILWNPQLTTVEGTPLPTPDGWLPDVGLALEVDSAEHHASPDDWRRTLGRNNELSQYGVAVLHFTPTEIRQTPRQVLATIERAYLIRRDASPRVDVLTRAPY
jgi:Transcriptional regulator, AbiEi antitoxin